MERAVANLNIQFHNFPVAELVKRTELVSRIELALLRYGPEIIIDTPELS
jgi:hypothetical protein